MEEDKTDRRLLESHEVYPLLSTRFLILELNWTVKQNALAHCLDLSTPPHPGRNALAVTLRCHALTCQQGALHKTALGKLWLHFLQSHCSRQGGISLSGNFHRVKH